MPQLAIPLTRGLDRSSGSFVVDPTSALELRDVLPREGKVQVRPGMGVPINAIAGTDRICHQIYFEATAQLLAITYTEASRSVDVYQLDVVGMGGTLIANWGTLAAGAIEPPRFSHSESFSYLVLCHDEPSVTNRLVTQVYDGAALAAYVANLDATSDKDYLARGTVEHLGYAWSWGFGSDSDKSRPEVVRAHRPADPRQLDGNLSFQVGARDTAVLACRSTPAGLLVLKSSTAYLIVGTDYQTFGVVPADPSFGTMAMRLAVAVGGYVYSWTHQGPRRTATGYFEPLEVPLELRERLPAGLPEGAQLQHGHATYWADEDMILWIFPDYVANVSLVYALSLRGDEFRWAYWSLPAAVSSVAVVTPTPESAAVAPGFATGVSHSGVQVGALYQTKVAFTLNSYVGDETVEVWGRQGADPYGQLATFALRPGATQSELVAFPAAGAWDVAVRFSRNGVLRASYTGDPATWTATSLGTGTIVALAPLIPLTLTYAPGASLSLGTYGASWSAPATGAAVQVYASAVDEGLPFTTPTLPAGITIAADRLVHTSAPDATAVSGLAVAVDGRLMAGAFVYVHLVQTLAVNGIAGSSLPSADSATVFFGLDEQPTIPGTPFTALALSVVSGTRVTLNWINSESAASATGTTEAGVEWIAGIRQNAMAVVALGTSHATIEFVAPNVVSCAQRGQGAAATITGWVRHLLTLGGIQQYTRWRVLGSTGGACQP